MALPQFVWKFRTGSVGGVAAKRNAFEEGKEVEAASETNHIHQAL